MIRLEKVALIIAAIPFLWLFLSWAEVGIKNVNPNPQYSRYNALVLFVEAYKNEAR